MLTRLGRFTVHRRRLVLSLTVLFMVVAGVLGTRAFEVLQDGGFAVPGSESEEADRLIAERFGDDEPNVILVVTASGGDVDAPDAAGGAAELLDRAREVDHVRSATSYWELGSAPPLRSDEGDRALALVVVDDADAEDRDLAIEELRALADEPPPGLEVAVGGGAPTGVDIGHTIESDLARAELIAIPITLLLLLFVFRGLVAASLPLFVGIVAVLGTLLSLFVIGSITDVSIFAINLTTALGLGLAIDYSLFIVSRFREELGRGLDVADAVVRSVETAGRTVAISSLTVAVSLSALLVFPQYFLRSFAYSGIAVVLLALAASLLALPALLAVVGHRIDALSVFPHRPAKPEHEGFWYRTTRRVMARPVPIAVAVVALLLVLGSPFLGVRFASPDDRVLPTTALARVANDQLREDFSGNAAESFPIALVGVDDDAALTAYVDAVAALPGVDRVDGPELDGDVARLSVVPSIEMISPEGEDLVAAARSIDTSLDPRVGGAAAELVDTKATLGSRLPVALAFVVLATAFLLFLLSGGVLVPLKALVLNALSLTATYGAMVWIFQDGNLAGVLGFTATGTIDTAMPILMFCIAFGLSMDYEVFMLSRIKEEHDRIGDNDEAVALGLERTGRIVTAAALVLSVTFFAFATSGVSFIIMFGLGLGIAVLMDAFIIRGALVPAFMKLAGEANWWAPRPLRRLHDRFGITD